MSTYETRLEKHEEIAKGTMAFHFEKPEDFHFKAGQAIELVLPDLSGNDAQSDRHVFSIVSAPFENRLAIATRMRDSRFKGALGSLSAGAPVQIEGPFGSLTLHNTRTRPAVFIAGGIGITPFVSILRQAAKDRLAQRLVLIYSNRRPEDAAFLAELQALEQHLENFRLLATMTQMSESETSWPGATGTIDADVVKRAVDGLSAPIFYLAGPPKMVESMRNVLNVVGSDDDDIRSEAFYGYF